MPMPDVPYSRFGCVAGPPAQSPLETSSNVRRSLPMARDSRQTLLEGPAIDLRGHFEIAHINFRPEWR
jgi:hypothetical protein